MFSLEKKSGRVLLSLKTTLKHMLVYIYTVKISTVVPSKNDIDIVPCLQLLSKPLTCTLHLSYCESIDHSCINPILWIGSIHK